MRTFITTLLLLGLLLPLTGCGWFAAPEDPWYRKVRRGQLASVPFSHDLELLQYKGWRYIGKLPSEALTGEHVQFAIWHENADGKSSRGSSTAETFNGSWPTTDPDSRRVELDILINREWVDGLPVFRYRAIVNQQVVAGILDVPDSYRQDISTRPPETKTPIVVGEPIPIGTADLASWRTRDGGKTTFVMRPQEYHWFIQFDVVGAAD